MPIKLAVLISGGGTTLQNLIDVISAGQLNAEIRLVVGSRPGIKGLQRAADAKIMNFVVDQAAIENVDDFSRQIYQLIDDADADLIVLAGWMSLLKIPARYANRIINIHPGLLPSFGGKGMYGKRVHQAVIDHGCKVSGCTVHFVDESYDNGPIILQRPCPVLDTDTAETLGMRVFEEEKAAYPAAIRLYQERKLKVEGRRVRVLAEAIPEPKPVEMNAPEVKPLNASVSGPGGGPEASARSEERPPL